MAPASSQSSSFLQTIGLTSSQHRPTSPSSFSSSSSSFYSPAMAEVSRTRQQYARLLADNNNDGVYDPNATVLGDNDSEDSIPMTPTAQLRKERARKAKKAAAAASHPRQNYLPTARRFWADFTLGFADGLTVPFALTAGLSSLGRTDTVVYAGMAEVSAGCISMGIGGYLSARQSASTAEESTEESNDLEASREMGEDDQEKAATLADITAVAHRYLAPLALPAALQQQILAHVTTQPHATQGLLAANSRKYSRSENNEEDSDCGYYEPPKEVVSDDVVWPIAAGFSVALGYLIGGLLPLWPYFFVTHVGDGLRYSFAVCVVALFLFGFIRDFALDSSASSSSPNIPAYLPWRRSRIPWRRLWKSTFEGLQMVILGGIAAIAAVLCVRLFEGANTSASS